MRIVVFGWGNEARGDDALGPLLVRRIEAMCLPDVETIEDYQLQVEHALDLEGFDMALFIDASRVAPAPFGFVEIGPSATRTPTTHALSPQAVLDVFVKVTGRPPPAAFVLGVRGERFGLGEELSPASARNFGRAARFCDRLMAERGLDRWREWAAASAEGKLDAAEAPTSSSMSP
jgi:hydrogenase maturation protease